MSSFAQKWSDAGETLRALEDHGMRPIRPGPEGLRDAHFNNMLRDAIGSDCPGGGLDHAIGGLFIMTEPPVPAPMPLPAPMPTMTFR